MRKSGLLYLALLAACAQPASGRAQSAGEVTRANDSFIPFTQAEVDAVGRQDLVRWSADQAGRVTVFATNRPDDSGTRRLVGTGADSGSVAVADASEGGRQYFELIPDLGQGLIVARRHLGLATVPNLRDIGSYRAADGRWLRVGLLYRADQLDKVSEADQAAISRLGIHLVADLRTDHERREGADILPAGARYEVFDILGSHESPAGAWATVARSDPHALMKNMYRELVVSEGAQGAYRDFLQSIVAAPGAVLYHCSAGKDRTGWATAIILTLLGVPREVVIEDYLASNIHLAAKYQDVHTLYPDVDREKLKVLYSVDRSFIEASFDEVDRRFGSFESYARNGLGVTDDMRSALRNKYLLGG